MGEDFSPERRMARGVQMVVAITIVGIGVGLTAGLAEALITVGALFVGGIISVRHAGGGDDG